MTHEHESVIRRHVASLARGEVENALRDYSDDAVLHYPGQNALSGDHSGKEAIADFLGKAMAITGGTFRPETHDVLANDDHAVLLVRCRAQRDGETFEWLAADVYHVKDGEISEHWILEGDQAKVDKLFRE